MQAQMFLIFLYSFLSFTSISINRFATLTHTVYHAFNIPPHNIQFTNYTFIMVSLDVAAM